MVLDFRGDLDLFPCQDRADPFRGPSSLGSVIDPGQRLQLDGVFVTVGQGTAQIMPVTIHGERGRPDRTAKVERKDLRVRVTAELERHESKQNRLAGPRRSHNEGVADITDMERESEWGRSLGLAKQERRTLEV